MVGHGLPEVLHVWFIAMGLAVLFAPVTWRISALLFGVLVTLVLTLDERPSSDDSQS
jgi:hypothetical protein